MTNLNNSNSIMDRSTQIEALMVFENAVSNGQGLRKLFTYRGTEFYQDDNADRKDAILYTKIPIEAYPSPALKKEWLTYLEWVADEIDVDME